MGVTIDKKKCNKCEVIELQKKESAKGSRYYKFSFELYKFIVVPVY